MGRPTDRGRMTEGQLLFRVLVFTLLLNLFMIIGFVAYVFYL